ncbi:MULTISPECIES: CRISPR-associated protein Csx19 [Spirulina sp. CCY15215]|uniref:type III-D CRISPR-associated protein Csx19 n=1 Tax=Spirulina sp. CCY15215 TaxID=2767591 RepID=UPI00194ECBB3|nr:CRISPR-associated protein Csx19 [Spirulina major]
MIIEEICKHLSDPSFASDRDLQDWIDCQQQKHQFKYLLVHADDGVIWGRFDDNHLTTAETIFCKPDFDFPSLQVLTLQQCRMFNSDKEILLWRSGETWRSRLVQEIPDLDKIPEGQILWGTHGEKRDKFTLLWDGSQGLKHAVPFTDIDLEADKRLTRPIQLMVHHYIDYDSDGVARIVLSRLVDLTTKNLKN